MHIILFFTYGISLKDWDESGILNREIELYKSLSKNRNTKFTFVTYGDKEDLNYSNILDDLNIIPIYSLIDKSKYKILNFFKSLIISKKLSKIISNPTYLKTNQLNGSWVAMLIKFYTKTPLYIRTGYNLFEFSIKDKKGIIKKLFYYFLTQFGLFYSNAYSVTSNSDKLFLEKYFITKNVIVIPNWVVDVKKNEFNNRSVDKLLGVGRLERQKNFASIINVLSNTQIELDLVGEGSEKEALKKISNSFATNVNFLGRLDYKELNQLYLNYRIFILPSLFEGNPKVVLEAMSKGALVIARKNKNISEIIDHNQNGVLYENDDEVLQKINLYLNNKSEWKRITSNAYKSIEMNNTIESIINKEMSLSFLNE
tara:strand:- start:3239 stop:4348 length:1110 start_codon:yes stop_codon:yes gene_type:complete